MHCTRPGAVVSTRPSLAALVIAAPMLGGACQHGLMATGDDERMDKAAPRRPRPLVRRTVYSAIGVGAVGGLILGLLFVFQRSLIYLPDGSGPPPAEQLLDGGIDITLRTSDGLELGAYLARPEESADRNMAVLAAPGNAGHRGGRADFATHLTDRGFTVLVLDYRGYGGNPGSPDEAGLHRDGGAAVEYLHGEGFDLSQVIYFGESLGTGVVAGLLADHPPAGVVLRSPFTDLPAMADHTIPLVPVGWMVRDEFPVREQVSATDVPVAVIRGTDDEIVPTEQSAAVAAAADGAGVLVEELVLEGAGHNDAVMFGPDVADVVARMVDEPGGLR